MDHPKGRVKKKGGKFEPASENQCTRGTSYGTNLKAQVKDQPEAQVKDQPEAQAKDQPEAQAEDQPKAQAKDQPESPS